MPSMWSISCGMMTAFRQRIIFVICLPSGVKYLSLIHGDLGTSPNWSGKERHHSSFVGQAGDFSRISGFTITKSPIKSLSVMTFQVFLSFFFLMSFRTVMAAIRRCSQIWTADKPNHSFSYINAKSKSAKSNKSSSNFLTGLDFFLRRGLSEPTRMGGNKVKLFIFLVGLFSLEIQ
ncbi:hypothetical protein AGMMS50249_2030 [candidate division SR1 bacterium]|nr:hypothetical protein AGMMS50249_2030 [candidate division SR1 bacterium]